jgi:hypothetical protein
VTTTNDAPSPNANRFAPLQAQETAPRNEGVREELRRLQDQVAQLGRRLHGVLESSSARFRSGAERRAPTHRPQHERQTLAPRRRTPLTHGGYMAPPPRWNMWVRRHDYAAPPRETQQRHTDNIPRVGRLPPALASPRREAPTLKRREENVPIATPQPVGLVVPPASQVAPQAQLVTTENQR